MSEFSPDKLPLPSNRFPCSVSPAACPLQPSPHRPVCLQALHFPSQVIGVVYPSKFVLCYFSKTICTSAAWTWTHIWSTEGQSWTAAQFDSANVPFRFGPYPKCSDLQSPQTASSPSVTLPEMWSLFSFALFSELRLYWGLTIPQPKF